MRTLCWSILLAGLLMMTSGCGFKDIDKRAFVVSIGFDISEERPELYRITAKIAIPTGDPREGKSDFLLLRQEAESISEGLRLLKSKTDKELDYGHMKVILFGEQMVKEQDIVPVLEFLIRRRDVQMIAYVAIARPNAVEVLQVKPKQERIAGNYLFYAFGETGTESPYIYSAYLAELMRRIHERGVDPVLPLIEARKTYLEIDKVVLMKKNKYGIELTPRETKLFRMLVKSTTNSTEVLHYQGGLYAVNLETGHASFSIQDDGMIRVKLKTQGILEEKHSELLVTSSLLQVLAREEEKVLREQSLQLLQKFQALGIDPLGLGLRYKATHFNNKTEWRDWVQLYPQAKFDVQVSSKLYTPGVVR